MSVYPRIFFYTENLCRFDVKLRSREKELLGWSRDVGCCRWYLYFSSRRFRGSPWFDWLGASVQYPIR